MLNRPEWQHSHPEYLNQALALLNRAEECLEHLAVFPNDSDAVQCLLTTLHELEARADSATVQPMADFSRRLKHWLDGAYPATDLQGETLHALKRCFTLLAWQREFIDPRDGQLLLDGREQEELLEKLTQACQPENRLPMSHEASAAHASALHR